ncbi:MAG TPA: hypothetical protein VMI75_18710 [Polyangiaceae bacterium]|nr:hypothetical protein [Polyangiaceae bacterium]
MKRTFPFAVAGLAAAAFLASPSAKADPTTSTDTNANETAERVPKDDPTGGAYTSPTLLFIPAGALPAWNVRVTALSEFQSPYQAADAPLPDAGIRPGAGVELGLPAGFAVAAGTNWVGGDVNDSGQKDFNLGLSPYFQGRFHIFGDRSGQDFQLGTSVTYKFVGFEGDPGEVELALSAQYRKRSWEAGLQAVMGKDFATTDADAELHAYALYRVVPQLGIGAAGQVRDGVVIQPGETSYDAIAGGIVSFTITQYQLGGLFGASTLGLDQGHFGALGQLFASARF